MKPENCNSNLLSLYHADCMDIMREYPDKHFDLAIVDPPYGIGETAIRAKQRVPKTQSAKWKNRRAPDYKGSDSWDDTPPDATYFTELRRVAKNVIIWGANHFGMMPPSSGWVVWYKKRFDEENDFSDAELAYTSFNKGCRLFHLPWIGFGAVNAKEDRTHPTQKPVKLYQWLLTNYAKKGDKILDTHLGSMSSVIACLNLGYHITGVEKDADYFQQGIERVKNHLAQGTFSFEDCAEAQKPEQTSLF